MALLLRSLWSNYLLSQLCFLTPTCMSSWVPGSGLPRTDRCLLRNGWSNANEFPVYILWTFPLLSHQFSVLTSTWPFGQKQKSQVPFVTKYYIQFIEQHEHNGAQMWKDVTLPFPLPSNLKSNLLCPCLMTSWGDLQLSGYLQLVRLKLKSQFNSYFFLFYQPCPEGLAVEQREFFSFISFFSTSSSISTESPLWACKAHRGPGGSVFHTFLLEHHTTLRSLSACWYGLPQRASQLQEAEHHFSYTTSTNTEKSLPWMCPCFPFWWQKQDWTMGSTAWQKLRERFERASCCDTPIITSWFRGKKHWI